MPVRALRLSAIRGCYPRVPARSESSNARQGIKTEGLGLGVGAGLGPNHRMPVRALRRYEG